MVRTKGTTTPKSLQLKMIQEAPITNNGGDGDSSSFRVLYYGDASTASVPFMWESQPGTPKHPTTQPPLPPLTPPPAYTQFSHVVAAQSSTSDSRTSYDSSATLSTSLRSLLLASRSGRENVAAAEPAKTVMGRGRRETELFGRRRSEVKSGTEEDGGGSPTATGCFGGGIKKVCRMKKLKSVLMSW